MFLCEFILFLLFVSSPLMLSSHVLSFFILGRLYQFHMEHCVIYCPPFDFNVGTIICPDHFDDTVSNKGGARCRSG